jgi:ligand-binding sensor domain-containing protein
VAELTGSGDKRTLTGHLGLAPGAHRLRVVVADVARNETSREIDVEVPVRPPFVRTIVSYKGRLWVGTYNEGLYVVDAKPGSLEAAVASKAHPSSVPAEFRMVNGAIEIRDDLYVAANEGLFVTADGAHFRRVRAVGARGVTGVAFDGVSLYASTASALWRVRLDGGGPPNKVWWRPAGSRSLQGVVAGPDGIWLASEDRGVIRFDGKTFVAHDRVAGLPTSWVVSIADDGHGGVFAGTLRDGALHVDRDGRWHKLEGLPSEWTLTVALGEGQVCVGTQEGAACYDERAATESDAAPPTRQLSSLPDARVHSFLTVGGSLFVGTQAGMAIVPLAPSS